MKPKAAKPTKVVEPSVTEMLCKQNEILWNLAAVVNDVAQVVKELAAVVKGMQQPVATPDAALSTV